MFFGAVFCIQQLQCVVKTFLACFFAYLIFDPKLGFCKGYSLQKTANIWKMRAFWKLPKVATNQRLWPLQNPHFESKIKNAKKHAKNVFTTHCSCCMQKTPPKNTLDSKNESILKIAKNGHQTKAIAFAKSLLWVKNYKCKKNMLKTFLQHIAVVVCKKRLQKTPNIRKMRAFSKCCRNLFCKFFCIFNFWPKVRILQRL